MVEQKHNTFWTVSVWEQAKDISLHLRMQKSGGFSGKIMEKYISPGWKLEAEVLKQGWTVLLCRSQWGTTRWLDVTQKLTATEHFHILMKYFFRHMR